MITVNQNSYISIENANNYFSNRLYCDGWTNATTEDKEKALIMATKKIDRQIFVGTKLSKGQPLQFPRYFENEVSVNVLDAVCEEALAILTIGNSNRVKLQEQGVKSFTVGSLSETYDNSSKKLLSVEAKELLKPYLLGCVRIC